MSAASCRSTDGYYYYNADYSKSKVAGGSYQSANYAYFDEGSKTFKVYDTWGIKKIGAGNQQGQFFPFTNPPPQTSSL